MQQRDADKGDGDSWSQKWIHRCHGGVLRLRGLQSEEDEALQVNQFRGQLLPEDRSIERVREPGGDGLGQEPR